MHIHAYTCIYIHIYIYTYIRFEGPSIHALLGSASGMEIASGNRFPILSISGNRIWSCYTCSKHIIHFKNFWKSHPEVLYKLQSDLPFHVFLEIAFGVTIHAPNRFPILCILGNRIPMQYSNAKCDFQIPSNR